MGGRIRRGHQENALSSNERGLGGEEGTPVVRRVSIDAKRRQSRLSSLWYEFPNFLFLFMYL